MNSVTSSVLVLSALAISGCAGRIRSGAALDAYRTKKATIAVVSLYVNDYRAMVDHLHPSSGDIETIMEPLLGTMVSIAEEQLGAHFQVKAASSFASQDGYKELSSPVKFDVFRPQLSGSSMSIFSDSEDDLLQSQMTAARAKQLCAILGVDMVAVVYSEWSTRTGRVIKTTKPIVETVLSIYDKSGEHLYRSRKDGGGRTVGGFSAFDIDRTITEWMRVYGKTLHHLVKRI